MLSGKINRYLVLHSDQPPFPSAVCDTGSVIPLTSPQEPSPEYETYLVRLLMPLTSVTSNTTLNSNSVSDILLPFSFRLLLFCPKDFGYGTSAGSQRISLNPLSLQRMLPPPDKSRIRSSPTIRSLVMSQKFPSLTVFSRKAYYPLMTCVPG